MIPNASDLIYFVEVANTLNISRAAERLGISQPSLTLAIQRLENTIGTQILNRNKKGVALTQPGKQLLVHSKNLLQSWDQVKSQAHASTHEIQGTFTIGSHISVALYSLSGFLPELIKKYPKVEIKLKHDLSRKITEGVISSTIDVGIVVNPVRHGDLIIHKLCNDEVTFWTSEKRSPSPKTSQKNTVLICDPDLLQSQSLMKQIRKSGIEFNRIIESASLEVIADLTANGCGIGILPSRVAALSKTKLHQVPQSPVFHDEICLLYRVENKNIKTIQTICAGIKRVFNQSPT